MPKPMRTTQGDISGFFTESDSGDGASDDKNSNGMFSSLLNDTKSRTPLDLLQEDFPSTPTPLYSSRLFTMGDCDESGQLKIGALSPSPRITSTVPTSTGSPQHSTQVIRDLVFT